MGITERNLREVGRLGRPHGVRGEINMVPVSPDLDRLLDLKSIYLGTDSDSATLVGISSIRMHRAKKGPTLLLQLEGHGDRDSVALVRGNRVFALDTDLPDLGTEEYYYTDIIGYNVLSESGEVLGEIEDVLDRPPQDLLVVRLSSGDEAFIPLVDEFVLNVDQERGCVVVAPIEGLI